MRVQKLAYMTKDFATFDCDAHITEPPQIWERAHEHLTHDELEALKQTCWWDSETKQLLVNGKSGLNADAVPGGGSAGSIRATTVAGPGVTHDIQRALHVRNLRPETALTKEQSAYLNHSGSYEPQGRLRDMEVQGIDQVMIIPTNIDTYPWLANNLGARAFCKIYNDWAHQYTRENPERLYFAALLPIQDVRFAVQEVYRVAAYGCRVCLIRPMDAMGNYPVQPKYEPLWEALEETGIVYGMHPFPAGGAHKPPGYTEQYSAAELIDRTIRTSGVPHTFLQNMQAFMAEASIWVMMVLMSGFFERHPKIMAAVFESDCTWLNLVLDECDKAYRLHRNDRSMPPLTRLPSESFFEHCINGFEGDEAFASRLPEYYGEIAAWSSDIYHHDGDDAWQAIQTMQSCGLPIGTQAKMLGENARRLYRISPPKVFIRERICEIQRPDWWPEEKEIEESLKPESALTRWRG